MSDYLDLHMLREKLEKQLKEQRPTVRISMTKEQATALLRHVEGEINDWDRSMSDWSQSTIPTNPVLQPFNREVRKMTSNPAFSAAPSNRRPRMNDVGRYQDHRFTIFATSNSDWCRKYAGEFLKSLPPITHEDGTTATLLIDAIGSDEFLKCIEQNKRNPLDNVVLRQVDPAADNIAELQRIACTHTIQRNTNLVMFEDISDPATTLPPDGIRELFQTSHHLAFGLTVGGNLGLFEEVIRTLGVSTADLRILMKADAQPFQLFYNGLNQTDILNQWVRAHLRTQEPADA